MEFITRILEIEIMSDEYEAEDSEDQLIEGLGNETLAMLILFMCSAIYLLICLYRNRNRLQRIHPEAEEGIQLFRRARTFNISPEERDRRLEEYRALAQEEKVCPICYGEANYAILTNCGHIFCCSCIHGYWRYSGNLLKPVECAVCRTAVTMLLPVDWPNDPRQEENNREREADASENEENSEEAENSHQSNNTMMDDYNTRFSGNRPWRDYLKDLSVVIPWALRHLLGFNGLLLMFRIRAFFIVIAAALYVISPLDIIPDFATGFIGIIDDLFIAFVLLLYVAIAVRTIFAGRNNQQPQPQQEEQ